MESSNIPGRAQGSAFQPGMAPWAQSAPSTNPMLAEQKKVNFPPDPTVFTPPPPPINFIEPEKRINCGADLDIWAQSPAYFIFMCFILAVSEKINNVKISECKPTPQVKKFISLIKEIEKLLDQFPPQEISARYGNPAFRTFFAHLEENAVDLVQRHLPEKQRGAAIELGAYLLHSMGNKTRIDYGSGHEVFFAFFLAGLWRLGVFAESDLQSVGLGLFPQYLSLIRRIQTTYQLEPAGSHGVWGLDDYQFLPFLFGAFQLKDHKHIRPKSVLNEDILQTFSKDYLYLAGIQFIHKMKTGPFHEHSPILHDITAVQKWEKVASGMVKMYKAEVLGKYPVVQHLLFGALLPFDWEDERIQLEKA
eukprot:GCRY01003131.1.p1 GENE.GCRY01003131.1~~GCRY01003131.1.p1  ORF type:complete len:363 (-),score=70.22 GCRY01003131.1:112-1200(-)